MLILKIALIVILVITSLLLTLFILLHKGRGGGLSDMFGGGVTSSLGSSGVAERNLNRITIVVSLVWVVSIIALGLIARFSVVSGSITKRGNSWQAVTPFVVRVSDPAPWGRRITAHVQNVSRFHTGTPSATKRSAISRQTSLKRTFPNRSIRRPPGFPLVGIGRTLRFC